MELGLPRKYLQRTFLSSGISPYDIHRRSTGFLRILKQQKHCQLGLKGQRVDEMEESSQTPKVLQAGNRHVKLLTCKYIHSFMKKQGWLRRQSTGHRVWSCKPQRIVLQLGNPTFAQLDFEVAWDWWLLCYFHFLPFQIGIPTSVILCLSLHLGSK